MSTRPSLFDAAAERLAMRSGRPKSQEKLELVNPARAEDFDALWECICGGTIGRNPHGRCNKCGK